MLNNKIIAIYKYKIYTNFMRLKKIEIIPNNV